ncbi:acyl-CoA esterase [Pseudovibrio sp. W64]|uniref:alpha/beta fold hydrolase n=1 Tax=unclassified Pseudovibrio TaxID=2627060 RepID=UPI0007AEC99D|nr:MULTISPECIES: alpha/beta hydrolase [unclassified Pseudovibrio]KZK79321.1 acyl-CoA esterase [Pseudovibrio sp. W64]KZK94571.1 acyl-CoA esterase [Pseudovibrio sp. W74]KZL06970.1 acyl-CoA esterase [Pseudovibrio sp. Ad14]
MNRGTHEFIGADGNRIVADRFGSKGQPVMMMHGGGQTRHSWGKTAEMIANAGMQAFCLDMRGHGDSAWVEGEKYFFSDFGADVAAAAAQIYEETGFKPIAIGASLGGLASILAEGALRPGVLAGVILVDVTPRLDEGGVSKILSFMAEKVEDGFGSVEEAADMIASYLPHRKRPKTLDGLSKNLRLRDDGRYRWHWDPRFITHHADRADMKDKVQSELLEAAANLKVPSMLVRGAASELVKQSHVDEFLALVPHAQFTDVKEAGHMVAGDVNDIFTAAIMPFLKEYQAAA